MACPGTQKIKCEFSFASSSDNALSKDGGITEYREQNLKNSGFAVRSAKRCVRPRKFDSRVFGDVKDRRCIPVCPGCLISCADGAALLAESPCGKPCLQTRLVNLAEVVPSMPCIQRNSQSLTGELKWH